MIIQSICGRFLRTSLPLFDAEVVGNWRRLLTDASKTSIIFATNRWCLRVVLGMRAIQWPTLFCFPEQTAGYPRHASARQRVFPRVSASRIGQHRYHSVSVFPNLSDPAYTRAGDSLRHGVSCGPRWSHEKIISRAPSIFRGYHLQSAAEVRVK